MARPRKPDDEIRKPWEAVHATPAERAEIKAAARERDMSASQYLLSLHKAAQGGGGSRQPRHAKVVPAITAAEQALMDLSQELRSRVGPGDAVMLQACLLVIERRLRQELGQPASAAVRAPRDASQEGRAPCS